jgi:ferric-dicitrate binding protein FerR (iron transport regulator)
VNPHDEHELSPAERATRDAVRALAHPRADDAFRARLRHEFVSGRIGRRRERSAPRPWYARGALLAPLAAGLVAVALLAMNRGPDWRVVALDGAGEVVVDGVEFAPGDTLALAERIARGGRVVVRGAMTLDLVAPGVAAVALAPGADVLLSSAPNRWWWRAMNVQLAAGYGYFSTGRQFHGATLDVSTSQARVRAVGTSFAVLCAPEGTCVCVMQGRVTVGGRDAVPGTGVEVPSGMRRVVHVDQVAETLPILEDSVHRLHQQLAAAGSALGR